MEDPMEEDKVDNLGSMLENWKKEKQNKMRKHKGGSVFGSRNKKKCKIYLNLSIIPFWTLDNSLESLKYLVSVFIIYFLRFQVFQN